MNFNTIKEMEVALKNTVIEKHLHTDLTFVSQGISYTCKFLGSGSSAGEKNIRWLDDHTATNIGVNFTDDENGQIIVNEVKINKFEPNLKKTA